MVTTIIQHEVKDFKEWKKVFDQDVPNLEKVGVKLINIYTLAKDPNNVTMIFEAPNTEIYNVLMSDPHRQEEIKRGGVISSPSVTFLNKVG
jgi:hypothetical protein